MTDQTPVQKQISMLQRQIAFNAKRLVINYKTLREYRGTIKILQDANKQPCAKNERGITLLNAISNLRKRIKDTVEMQSSLKKTLAYLINSQRTVVKSGHRIACAATKCIYGKSELIVAGIRHLDETMSRAISLWEYAESIPENAGYSIEDGFLDHYGRFLTRQQAYDVALAANQIICKNPGEKDGHLYSENLY